jgi:hypothetical protein
VNVGFVHAFANEQADGRIVGRIAQISVNRVDIEIEFSGKFRFERLCLQFEYDIAT